MVLTLSLCICISYALCEYALAGKQEYINTRKEQRVTELPQDLFIAQPTILIILDALLHLHQKSSPLIGYWYYEAYYMVRHLIMLKLLCHCV